MINNFLDPLGEGDHPDPTEDDAIRRGMWVEAKNMQPLPRLGDETGELHSAVAAMKGGYDLSRGLPEE